MPSSRIDSKKIILLTKKKLAVFYECFRLYVPVSIEHFQVWLLE